MRSHARGFSEGFDFELKQNGFVRFVPAGPATLKYSASFADGTWHEIGERIVEGKPPARVFEMTSNSVGKTDWTTTTPVPMTANVVHTHKTV